MASQKYKDILSLLRKEYGNKAQDGQTLNDLGLTFFDRRTWGGVHPYDTVPIEKYKNKTYLIVNTDDSNGPGIHWMSIIKNKSNIYVYDSFGRRTSNVLKKFNRRVLKGGYRIVESKRDAEQSDYQEDCGLRCIAWLLVARKYGIRKALTI